MPACLLSLLLILACLAPRAGWAASATGEDLGEKLSRITLPPGFSIQLFAKDLENARSMTLGDRQTLFVGTRRQGSVYAIRLDKDWRPLETFLVASGLRMPNGVAFRNGALYVAEADRILRFDNIESSLLNPPKPVTVFKKYPSDEAHGWKYIAFGPDGKLYVPVGAPCNICERDNPIYASITRLDPDGRNLEIFARGVRNTVGFDFHPRTGELWFTNNGRDWMGDDQPPDTLHQAPRPGLHFGFPYCHAGRIPDPDHGGKRACAEFAQPAIDLAPHAAALGMKFYTGDQFPPEYQGQIFIAEHGSWNRSTPIGYRLTLVRLQGDRAASYETFAEGWLPPEPGAKPWGRPVDLLVLPDGSLLVSDDLAGAIYRITHDRP